MTPDWINRKSVASTVLGAVIVALLFAGVDFVAEAQDSHALAQQSAKTQKTMSEAVEKLVGIHEAEAAKEQLYLELCVSGKLAEPNDCAAAEARARVKAMSAPPS